MTVISLRARLQKIEATRARADRSIRDLSDQQLADALCEASADPADHAFAAWFLSGGAAPIAPDTLAIALRDIR